MNNNYIAAIVDGESQIGMSKSKGFTGNLVIYNTNLTLLEKIQNYTKLGIIDSRCRSAFDKYSYALRFRVNEIKRFLLLILDFLIIKKERAELLLKFLSIRKGHRCYPLNKIELESRYEYLYKMHELNEKGNFNSKPVVRFPALGNVLKDLFDDQIAYVAGLVDGEGSIFIQETRNCYYPIITITNTDANLIKYVQNITGAGAVSLYYNKNKVCYIWRIVISSQLNNFLIKLKNHLIIKKEQASLVEKLLNGEKESKIIIQTIRERNRKGRDLIDYQNIIAKELLK